MYSGNYDTNIIDNFLFSVQMFKSKTSESHSVEETNLSLKNEQLYSLLAAPNIIEKK